MSGELVRAVWIRDNPGTIQRELEGGRRVLNVVKDLYPNLRSYPTNFGFPYRKTVPAACPDVLRILATREVRSGNVWETQVEKGPLQPLKRSKEVPDSSVARRSTWQCKPIPSRRIGRRSSVRFRTGPKSRMEIAVPMVETRMSYTFPYCCSLGLTRLHLRSIQCQNLPVLKLVLPPRSQRFGAQTLQPCELRCLSSRRATSIR